MEKRRNKPMLQFEDQFRAPGIFINYPPNEESSDPVPCSSRLIRAAQNGALSQLSREAFTFEEIKAVDSKTWNFLHWAALKGTLAQLPQYFLQPVYFNSILAIDNNHAKSLKSKTPLHIAAEFGQLDKVPESLCTYDLFRRVSIYGETVFHTAIRCHCFQQIPKKLLTYESLALRDIFGWTVFHQLIYRGLQSLIPSELLQKFLRILDFPFPDSNLFSAPALAHLFGLSKAQEEVVLTQYTHGSWPYYHPIHPLERNIKYFITPTHTTLLTYRHGKYKTRFHIDGSIRDGFREEIIPWLPYNQRVRLGVELPSTVIVCQSKYRSIVNFACDGTIDYYNTKKDDNFTTKKSSLSIWWQRNSQ